MDRTGLVKRPILIGFCALLALPIASRTARAQLEEEEPGHEEALPDPAGEPAAAPVTVEETPDPDRARFGGGLRIRYVTIPQFLINLFVDHSTSMTSVGFGGELVRRKGNFDIVFGLEYENISPADGLYQEKDEDPAVPGQYPDLTEFDGLGLLGIDVAFIWHTDLHPKVQLRYGAGLGVGLVLGKIYQTDTMCPAGTTIGDLDDPNHCPPAVGAAREEANVPPVVPIVNLLLGFRFKVNDQISVNLEGGFRNMFFFGLGTDYMF